MPLTASTNAATGATTATGSCRTCGGTGWADPWVVADGCPELVWCKDCLGAGLAECDACDGAGVVPVEVPCACTDDEEVAAGRAA